MKPTDKIRVAVLFGGRSAEHEVSLQSAKNVIHNLDTNQFEVVPIGVDKQGNWFLGHDVFTSSIEQNQVYRIEENSRAWFTPEWVGTPVDSAKAVIAAQPSRLPKFDVVFPAMHGSFCEDGTLQGLLELANLPYVGAGVLSSAVGMDKDVSKRLAMNAGINVAPYILIKQDVWKLNPVRFINLIEEKISYPVFVKPVNTGSSIGITKVKSSKELQPAIDEAFRFDTKVMVEKGLNVQELEIAVLESLESSDEPIVSVVGEIVPSHEFYSYDAKYVDDKGAELLIPANVSKEIQERARAIAKELFIILDCEGMARIDLFLDKETQEIYFNEVNTLPGFTKISMYPKLMAASGVEYADLLSHLIQLAIKRHKSKSKLSRSYVD
ncbi:MAG TPA: D-alanine--D-alanine ligase family protein [Gammaproteobacteria bacterium]|jgi:D-alanine-D-alanine ligase|nr:D-alanine--D-alanine ligase family protein [Gammaproteobacteria bacterium]